ncbi:MAG: GtrA family protein [Clostridia bacterium]|nr:GtrA family protein [Clostridia bacterium]
MTPERKKEIFRSLKFLCFSISAGIIEMLSFALISIFLNDTYYVLKAFTSLTLSVIWNFTFNRKFTFKSASNVPIAMIKVLCYYVIFAPLSIFLADIYLVKTLRWNEFIVKAITMIINFVTEFLYQRFFVFKNSLDTNVKKDKTEQSVK